MCDTGLTVTGNTRVTRAAAMTDRHQPPTGSEGSTTEPSAGHKKATASQTPPGPPPVDPQPLESSLFFRIRGAPVKNIVAGYATPPEEAARAMMTFRSALEALEVNRAKLVPEVAYGASSGDALIVLVPGSAPQYGIMDFRSGLVAVAQRYNALSERVKENARSSPRKPTEAIVPSSAELKVLRGLANLRATRCSIWVVAADGRELEIVPPDLEDLSSPPKSRKLSLKDAPVTGCDLGQEGTHIVVVEFVYRLRLAEPEESMIKHFCQRERFSGRISKVGNEWRIEDGYEYRFS